MQLRVGTLAIFLFSFAAFAQTSESSLIEKAQSELTHKGSDTAVQLQTPATIATSVDEVVSPLSYAALQLGLSYEKLQPMGRGQVTGLADVEWDKLPPLDFISVEMKWMPYQWERFNFGTFASLGYGSEKLNLQTATGDDLPKSKLSIARWYLGFVAERQFFSTWSSSLSLGTGQFLMSQSAASSYVSDSSQLGVGVAQISVQKRIAQYFIPFVAYQQRFLATRASSRLDIDRQGVVVGIMGSLR